MGYGSKISKVRRIQILVRREEKSGSGQKMRYAVAIKPDNNKNTSRELPSIVADGAGNERLSPQISKRDH